MGHDKTTEGEFMAEIFLIRVIASSPGKGFFVSNIFEATNASKLWMKIRNILLRNNFHYSHLT